MGQHLDTEGLPQKLPRDAGESDQRPIATGVPEMAVDLGEVVEVDQEQAGR